MLWKWKAIDQSSRILKGIWVENEESQVLSRLRELNLCPVSISRAAFSTLWLELNTGNKKRYWGRTARKIGTMLTAGIPLLAVLEAIADRETNLLKRNQWKKVVDSLQAGEELFVSLQGIIPAPGAFFYTMLQAGERSGTLAASMSDIADYLEEQDAFEKKIRSTLFYPLLLLVTAVVVIYALSVMILPMYQTLFEGLDAELPIATKIMFQAGAAIPYSFVIFPIAGIVIWGFLRKRSEVTIPGTARINHLWELIQFCSILDRLLKAGLPLQEALILQGNVTKDITMKKLTQNLIQAVGEGKRLSHVIVNDRQFPPEAAKMLEVAEESGKLDEMLGYLVKIFKQELQENIQKYTKLLEPILILGMAGLVGFVAIGVLLPIFDVSTYIK